MGQIPSPIDTVYIERAPSSVGKWILGTIAVGGALLWARHQSRKLDQLYTTAGLPQQSFAEDLRQSASTSLQGLAERVRPKRSSQGRNER